MAVETEARILLTLVGVVFLSLGAFVAATVEPAIGGVLTILVALVFIAWVWWPRSKASAGQKQKPKPKSKARRSRRYR
jgi:hypothetical protein